MYIGRHSWSCFVLGPTGRSICKDEGATRPRIRTANVPRVARVGAQLPWGVNRVKLSELADGCLRVRIVTSKTAVGVAVVNDGLFHANKRLQHLSAVVKMQAGDNGVRPEEACCSIITEIAGRGETASNEGILAAANARQHTGMQHLAAPLQENGAGWPF